MELKNLFDYAPKELTQDGFLRWVIENYEHPDIQGLARDLIRFLTEGFKDTPTIDIDRSESPSFSHLATWSQVGHMDVGVDFFYEGHEECSDYVLIIEDKVGSQEHDNQLEKYNEVLKSWRNPYDHERAIRVYYKTYPISDDERVRVEQAKWKLIPFKEIVAFWKAYVDHPNMIVRFYAKHICEIGESAEASSKPEDNDILAWKSFFTLKLKDRVQQRYPDAYVYIGDTRYGYAYLNVFKMGYKMSECPYLEIRSRDLLSEAFTARILRYGVEMTQDSLARLRNCIANQESRLFRPDWGTTKDKQLGHTKASDGRLSAADEEKLVQSLFRCVEEYLKIIQEWERVR